MRKGLWGIFFFLCAPLSVATNLSLAPLPKLDNQSSHRLGDYYGGGVIYYINPDPKAPAGQQGLIAAIHDAKPESLQFVSNGFAYVRTLPDLFSGAANTKNLREEADHTPAADAANHYSTAINCPSCTAWFLPSQTELNLMYQQKHLIDATAGANGGNKLLNTIYWSSTQLGSRYAWGVNFDNTPVDALTHLLNDYHQVRAVRAF